MYFKLTSPLVVTTWVDVNSVMLRVAVWQNLNIGTQINAQLNSQGRVIKCQYELLMQPYVVVCFFNL